MKRLLPRAAIALVALLAIVFIVRAAAGRQAGTGPTYSVVQLRSVLHRSVMDGTIRSWAGRTVRLRGVITGQTMTSDCYGSDCGSSWAYEMVAPRDPLTNLTDLTLQTTPDRSWTAKLRAIPILGSLLLPRHTAHIGVEATYRVRLEDTSDPGGCGPLWCFNAVLLDVAPPTMAQGVPVRLIQVALPPSPGVAPTANPR